MNVIKVLGAIVIIGAVWLYLVANPTKTLNLRCTKADGSTLGMTVEYFRKWLNPILEPWEDAQYEIASARGYATGYAQVIGSGMAEILILHDILSDGGTIAGRWDSGSGQLLLYAGQTALGDLTAQCREL